MEWPHWTIFEQSKVIERVGKGKKMQYLLLDLTGSPKSSCQERNSSPTDLILFPPSQGSVKGTTTHLVMQTRKPGVTVISLSSFTTSNQSLHFVFTFLIPHLPCFSLSPLHASLLPPPTISTSCQTCQSDVILLPQGAQVPCDLPCLSPLLTPLTALFSAVQPH